MQRTHQLKTEKTIEQASAFVVAAPAPRRRPTLDKSPWARSSWRSAPASIAKSGWGITRKS